MQNAIWKITALAGVVGIGFLVMLQAQRGLSRPFGQASSEVASSENGDAATDQPGDEQNLAGQDEPSFDAESHAGHNHEAHPEHGADGFGSAADHHEFGLDFRKGSGGGASAPPERSAQLPPDDELFSSTPKAPAAGQSEPPQALAADGGEEIDPFGAPPQGKPALAGPKQPAAPAANKTAPGEVEMVGHEDAADPDSAAAPENAADAHEPHGAGPRLLGPSADESEAHRAEEAHAAEAPHEMDIDDLDPFAAVKPAKPKQPAEQSGKPKADAAGAPRELADQPGEKAPQLKPQQGFGGPSELDVEPSADSKSPAAPKRGAGAPADHPQPDPSAFDPIDQQAEDGAGHGPRSTGREPNGAGGKPEKPAPAAHDNSGGPALVTDGPQMAADDLEPAPVDQAFGEPPQAKKDNAPPAQGHQPADAADAAGDEPLIDSGAPKRLNVPAETTPLDEKGIGDFHGDGVLEGNAPLGPQRPQLTIEKVAPPNATLGQPLIYSILVKNVGDSPAHDVIVEDRIPKGSKLSGTIPRAELAGKTLIWKLGDLKPDEQRKISVRVVPLEPGQIGSVATVNFVAEVAAETQITAPSLRIDLIGPSEAKLGEPVPFRFRVTNTGSGEARNVVIRDVIPEGLKHAAGNDLEYEVGRLPAGESREVELALTAAKIGQVVNRAIATADGGISTEAKANVEVFGAKLVVTRSGPTRRYVGRTAVYTNTVTNDSTRPVESATVTETVPEGFEFVEATSGGQYNAGARTVHWRLGRMAPGESRELKIKLVPKATGALTSVVTASASGGDSVETTSQTVVEGFAAVGLEIPNVETPVDVGEKVNLRVVARNRGNSPATNVVVTIEVPAEFKVVSARGPVRHEQSGNTVRFAAIPTIDGRTTAGFDLVLEAQSTGDARVRAQINGDQLETPLTREESILVLSDEQ